MKKPRIILLSAMYENGGNVTHRLLDGHPQLFVYPFESQLGTKYAVDHLTSLYPVKYRWPVFPGSLTPEQIYHSIIDEECKVRARTPYVSKFRTADFDFDDEARKSVFISLLKNKYPSRPQIIEAFFKATFTAWKNVRRTGRETYYVGYSPIIGVDGAQIIEDFKKEAFIIHVIRNPFSAFAETKKRPVPLSLNHYMTGWITATQSADFFAREYPDNFFIIRYEDIIENPMKAFQKIFQTLNISSSKTVLYPSWNGEKLKQVFPWGTIAVPSSETNLAAARKLSKKEISVIYNYTHLQLSAFNYLKFYKMLI